MGYVYPSMPLVDPCDPDIDGFAHITVHDDPPGITLRLRGRVEITIPGETLSRDSVRIEPGGDGGVNHVTVTFLASTVEMGENVMWTELVPDKSLVSIDGEAGKLRKTIRAGERNDLAVDA